MYALVLFLKQQEEAPVTVARPLLVRAPEEAERSKQRGAYYCPPLATVLRPTCTCTGVRTSNNARAHSQPAAKKEAGSGAVASGRGAPQELLLLLWLAGTAVHIITICTVLGGPRRRQLLVVVVASALVLLVYVLLLLTTTACCCRYSMHVVRLLAWCRNQPWPPSGARLRLVPAGTTSHHRADGRRAGGARRPAGAVVVAVGRSSSYHH